MLALLLASIIGADIAQFDKRVIPFFTDVVLRAALSNDFAESAAFLVHDGDGVRCLLWPTTDEYQKLTYRGFVPDGTIAIVHTHPLNRPKPSEADIQQAIALSLPMYVVTRSHITVIEPYDGNVIPVVSGRFWMATAVPNRCEQKWSQATTISMSTTAIAQSPSDLPTKPR